MKDKYKLDENVVIVEKSNTVKFLIKTGIALIRIAVAITIFLLAVIGLISLVYPDTRHELGRQGLQIYRDLLRLLPWGG